MSSRAVIDPEVCPPGSWTGADREGAVPARAAVIATKVRAPIAVRMYRQRERLSDGLDAALDDAIRLTLVSAPPGYGKSVAVAGWLESRGLAHAWVSLDAADNDPVRFLRYLLAALEPVRPGIGASIFSQLGPGATADGAVSGPAVIDAIASTEDPFVLVLDDYHVITAEPVHEFVRSLIEHGPPFTRVVVIGREDPPLRLPRLRAHGRLVELRVDRLRFSREESARYLADVAELGLDAAAGARLAERTEGWIAGLQLAAISLQGRSDIGERIDAFAGTQRFILDYLAEEVLGRLDPDLRDFLVRCSVAERFSVPLCQALSDRPDSGALLERAEQMNLFVVPLDLERRWYRFHHLFADYLRTLLDDAELRELHVRAAGWFEREGSLGEAIEHALAAGAIDLATRLVERAARQTYEDGEVSTLVRWLEALPADRVLASRDLISMRAYAAFQIGRVGDADRACRDAEAAHPGSIASGPMLTVSALIAAFSNRPEAIALGHAAVAAPDNDAFFRARALHALATAQQCVGELDAGAATARLALSLDPPTCCSTLVVPAETGLVNCLVLTGHRREAEAVCRRTLEDHRGEVSRMAGGTPYALYWLGMVLYEAGELDEASAALERGWAAMGTFGFGRALLTTAIRSLALTRQALGSPAGALEAVRTVARDAGAAGLGGVEAALAEIEARVCLMQGDLEAARRWAAGVRLDDGADEPTGPGWQELARVVTVARLRLAERRPDASAALLRRARPIAMNANDVADLISIDVLEAAALLGLDDVRQARRSLERALGQAAPEGYARRILDDGRAVAHLLPAVRGVAPGFVDRLVAAFAAPTSATAAGPEARRSEEDRHEPLTARELEVLRLMARGSSDAAIARSLVVSLATAKWHAAHIRAKLGAASRTEAVVRAQALGLV